MRAPLLAAAALLAGCQCLVPVRDCSREPCGPAPYDAGPRTSLQEFFERVPVEVTCGNFTACGIAAPGTSCQTLTWGSRFGATDHVWFQQRIDAGAVAFDLDAGLACLAAFQTTCDPGCWPPFRGLLAEGDRCESPFDCQPDLYCERDRCPFRCTKRLGDGAVTDDLAACGTESWSVLRDGGTRCVEPLPLGADCRARPDEIEAWRRCEGTLRCGLTEDGGRRCRTPLALGAACRGDDCGNALECRGNPLRCVLLAKEGERCANDGGTLFPRCFVGLSCANGICVPPLTTEGAPCDNYNAGCEPPLYCMPYSRTCVRISENGGPCSSQFECGNYLDACIDGVCQRPGGNGAACASSLGCATGLGCVKGRCGHFSCP